MVKTLQWSKGTLKLLDQLLLPHVVKMVPCKTVKATGEAIKKMQKTVAQKIQAMGGLSKLTGQQ
jgi:methylthioribose-1-phosphate isomerase